MAKCFEDATEIQIRNKYLTISFHGVIRFDFYWPCLNERVIVIEVLEKSANIALTQCDASCTGLSVCTFEFENNVLLPVFKIVPEQPDNTGNTMKIAVSYVYTVITRRFIRVTNRHTAFQVMENGLTKIFQHFQERFTGRVWAVIISKFILVIHMMAVMTSKCHKKVTEKWVFAVNVLADRLASSHRHVESVSPLCTLIVALLTKKTHGEPFTRFMNHYRSTPSSILNEAKRSSHSGESRSSDCVRWTGTERCSCEMEACAIISDISPRSPNSTDARRENVWIAVSRYRYRNPHIVRTTVLLSLTVRDGSLMARVTKRRGLEASFSERDQPVPRRENPRLRNAVGCVTLNQDIKTFDALTLRKLESESETKIAKNEDELAAILIKNCKHLSRADRRFRLKKGLEINRDQSRSIELSEVDSEQNEVQNRCAEKIHVDMEVSRVYGVYQETNPGHVRSPEKKSPRRSSASVEFIILGIGDAFTMRREKSKDEFFAHSFPKQITKIKMTTFQSIFNKKFSLHAPCIPGRPRVRGVTSATPSCPFSARAIERSYTYLSHREEDAAVIGEPVRGERPITDSWTIRRDPVLELFFFLGMNFYGPVKSGTTFRSKSHIALLKRQLLRRGNGPDDLTTCVTGNGQGIDSSETPCASVKHARHSLYVMLFPFNCHF
ncbi:hypothetical protein G5I_06196 [Acromyrmex echinatior]|uniref:Uncharacterized protein n=1 Tax=Acromyrmex echinatior TaxID=103372 RepID=F4WKB2_ACREC|nr:hypothetical protein G5I_06196 [Acromyrmex echinatior]